MSSSPNLAPKLEPGAESSPEVKPHDATWTTEKERSNTFALKLIVWIALHLGRTVARFFLTPISLYFWVTAPKARKASAIYLRRVERTAHLKPNSLSTYKHIHTFACVLLDRVFMLSEQSNKFDTTMQRFPEMKALHESRTGGLFIGAHFGSFEALRVLGTQDPGNHLALPNLIVRMAMYEENARKINTILEAINPNANQHVISLGQPDAMLQLDETVERGEFVGMLADRSLEISACTPIEFLGETALFPTGPFRLAMVLKRPVYLMFGMYLGSNRYEICFEQLPPPTTNGNARANRTEQLTQWQLAYVNRLEHFCCTAPYNWFNFYDFWKK